MTATQFENFYINDTIIKKYVSAPDTNQLLSIKIYNNDFKFILNKIKEKLINQYATINIYDNDTGLIGWCLEQFNYSSIYRRSSKYPMHAVYILSPATSATTSATSPTQNTLDSVNLHFITTIEEYKEIDFKSNKNVIFATKSFDKKFKFHKTPYHILN